MNVSKQKQSNDDVNLEKTPKLRFPEFNGRWKENKLIEIGEVQDGSHETPQYFEKGVPFIRLQNIERNKFIFDDIKYISYEKAKQLKRHSFRPGDILFNKLGNPIGKTTIAPLSIGEGIMVSDVVKIKPNNEFNYNFVVEYLNSPTTERRIEIEMTGSTRKRLNLGQVKNLKIIYPSIEEQNKLSNFLTIINKKIDLLEKKHKNIEKIILNYTNRIFNNSNIQNNNVKLKEIFNYYNSTALERFFNNKEGYNVISIGNYSIDGKYIDTNNYISREFTELKKYLLHKNELAMVLNDKTKDGNIIGRTILIDQDDKYIFNQRTARLVPKIDINIRFLQYLINSPLIHKKIFSIAQGATQIYINKNDLLNIEVPLPTQKNQDKIANLLYNFNKQKELLNKEIILTQKFKKALLQKMFV